MRFSSLLVGVLAPTALVNGFQSTPNADALSSAELVVLLERHNLAIVPKSDLTDALTELTSLLKAQCIQTVPRLKFKRQIGTAFTSTGSGSSKQASYDDDDDGTVSAQGALGDLLGDIPGIGDLVKIVESLGKMLKNLGDLPGIIKAVEGLLTAEFLQATHDAIIWLAQTLKPPVPQLVQSLLAKAGLLVDSLSKIDLEGLLDKAGPLLDKIVDVDLDGILDALSPLLTKEKINGIVKHLDNTSALLTEDTVK